MNSDISRLTAIIDYARFCKNAAAIETEFATVKQNPRESFIEVLEDLKELKLKVFDERFKEAVELFNLNKGKFKISTFELMKYNFHENSHTNVLQYLFDYHYSGDLGHRILKSFLNKIDSLQAKEIANLIKPKFTYYTQLESPVKKGRIDLLIVDDEAQFVVVIENKLLAEVSVTPDENETTIVDLEEKVTRTQLTKYKEFILSEYKDYTQLFILLSLKEQELIDKDYITLDYNFLLKVLQEIDDTDPILINYKLLLENILKGKLNYVSAVDAIELDHKVVYEQNNASLNEIETLKKYFL